MKAWGWLSRGCVQVLCTHSFIGGLITTDSIHEFYVAPMLVTLLLCAIVTIRFPTQILQYIAQVYATATAGINVYWLTTTVGFVGSAGHNLGSTIPVISTTIAIVMLSLPIIGRRLWRIIDLSISLSILGILLYLLRTTDNGSLVVVLGLMAVLVGLSRSARTQQVQVIQTLVTFLALTGIGLHIPGPYNSDIIRWSAYLALPLAGLIALFARPTVAIVIAAATLCLADARALRLPAYARSTLTNQPSVTLINNTQPASRMEFVCVPTIDNDHIDGGTRLITPHTPSSRLAVLPVGRTEPTLVDLPGEAPDHSIVLPNRWLYVDARTKGLYEWNTTQDTMALLSDLATETNVFYMHANSTTTRALISHDLNAACTEFSLVTNQLRTTIAPQPPNRPSLLRSLDRKPNQFRHGKRETTAECSYRNDGSIIYSGKNSPGLMIFDVQGRQVTHAITHNPSPFNQHRYWPEQDAILLPDLWSGTIAEYSSQDLSIVDNYDARVGVRGALTGCGYTDRFWAWNYHSGVIYEYSHGNQHPQRQWETGPILRSLRWDCDCTALLAATSEGAFRIELEE